MSDDDRASITNAIWLCRNCHKIVDADEAQFSAALLFEWRQDHERAVGEELGKTGEKLRRKAVEGELADFANESYLARQIVIDKPYAWEYRLTTELLRLKLEGPLWRWRALGRGLYTKPITRLSDGEALHWVQDRLSEISNLAPALGNIINDEFVDAWGPPGKPGSAKAILRVCNLFDEACQQLLRWEESVRFVRAPTEFGEVVRMLHGIGGRFLEQVAAVPTEMTRIFSDEAKPTGSYNIAVTISLPEGWTEKCSAALRRAVGD